MIITHFNEHALEMAIMELFEQQENAKLTELQSLLLAKMGQ